MKKNRHNNAVSGTKKILLFGFETLPEILPIASVAESFGAEAIPISLTDYRRSLADLAGLELSRTQKNQSAQIYKGGPLGGRMLVLCNLEKQLDILLDALARAGVGPSCLKAVLTPTNRAWDPLALYTVLQREQQQLGR